MAVSATLTLYAHLLGLYVVLTMAPFSIFQGVASDPKREKQGYQHKEFGNKVARIVSL